MKVNRYINIFHSCWMTPAGIPFSVSKLWRPLQLPFGHPWPCLGGAASPSGGAREARKFQCWLVTKYMCVCMYIYIYIYI